MAHAHAFSLSACLLDASYSAATASQSRRRGCERMFVSSGTQLFGRRSDLVWRQPHQRRTLYNSPSHTICRAINVEEGSFFDSALMQAEIGRIQKEYKELLHLGRNFGQFDREGKLSYISAMKSVLERWKIFYKRMELSDDFIAKLCAKQLKTKTGNQEESNYDALSSLYDALDDLKQDAETSI